MNRKVKEYDSVVSLRLARRDREDLERLCSALGVTKSEFVRKRIEILNNTIMNNNLFSIPPAPATDAWGRNIADEKGKKAKSNKNFNEQMNKEFDSQLMDEKSNDSGTKNGVTPFSTPEAILIQLKKRE